MLLRDQSSALSLCSPAPMVSSSLFYDVQVNFKVCDHRWKIIVIKVSGYLWLEALEPWVKRLQGRLGK